MFKIILFIIACVVTIGGPFLMRDSERTSFEAADDRLIILTPHNESIRHEFGRAFQRWYEAETGRTVTIDWRVIGGTSEIVRLIQSSYLNGFRNYWANTLGKRWSLDVQNSFADHNLDNPATAAENPDAAAARRAFLEADVSIGVDLFFGGGSFDFIQQARAGSLVSSRILETHPEWFEESVIPSTFSGEPFYDPEGRWIGTVLSSFGIIYNIHSLRRLGVEERPTQWRDLANPALIRSIGVADPSKSGSSNKAFEMIIQQEMQILEAELIAAGLEPDVIDYGVRREGWENGLRLIQLISANARYFTDSATKPSIDVSQGDAAAGMSIDFYGRFQQETLARRGDADRFNYITPIGGSTVSVDPIGLLRGAPNHEVAERFIEFVLSPAGQKLWDFRVGEEGGPTRFALRRSPIRKEFYEEPLNAMRSDPEVFPYREAESFIYRPEWTAALFGPLRFIIKTAFIDVHDDLVSAWAAINRAENEGRAEDAAAGLAIMQDLSRIDYETASVDIRATLRDRNRLLEVHLTNELVRHFRAQYQAAEARANGRR